MKKPKIQVILGSIREGRSGEKVAKWFMKAVKDQQVADLELVDLKDYPLPLFADPVSPKARGAGKHSNPAVQKWLDKLMEADGYIIITPEYDHGYPGALKNAIDYALHEWNNKSVGFVGYGGLAAGSRAVEQLRQVVAELSMYDVHTQLLIPVIWSAFDEQDNLKDSDMHALGANQVVQEVSVLASKLMV